MKQHFKVSSCQTASQYTLGKYALAACHGMVTSFPTRASVRNRTGRPLYCRLRNCAEARNGYISLYDLSDQIVDYRTAWKWQTEYAASLALERQHPTGLLPALVLLQHEPTYTLGTGSSLENLKFRPETSPHQLIRTERGGEVTFHGPGQLTVYPILDLKAHGQDLHKYLRALEQVIIDALVQEASIQSYRIEGLTGALPQFLSGLEHLFGK
jgi:hypothetical protein